MNQSAQSVFSAKIEKTSLDRVGQLAREHFGVVGEVVVLASERDETFLIRAADGGGHILKIAGPAERADLLRFQTDALAHLAAKRLPLPLPRPVPSTSGNDLLTLTLGGETRILRMLTFLEGTQIHEVPRSAGQMDALGTALGVLDRGLADFRPVVPKQNLLWDLCNAAALRDLTPHVGLERRDLVLSTLDSFDCLMAGPLRDLPRQVIHNDFNPHNILVDSADDTRITGVIDFGDMVEAPRINDVAVALSYLVAADTGFDDVAAMLRAYHRVYPLSGIECACLPTLLRMRLSMTITISEWRSALYPENSAYILRNHAVAWTGLAKLADHGDDALTSFFHASLGDAA